jgi:hypothetical protein
MPYPLNDAYDVVRLIMFCSYYFLAIVCIIFRDLTSFTQQPTAAEVEEAEAEEAAAEAVREKQEEVRSCVCMHVCTSMCIHI